MKKVITSFLFFIPLNCLFGFQLMGEPDNVVKEVEQIINVLIKAEHIQYLKNNPVQPEIYKEIKKENYERIENVFLGLALNKSISGFTKDDYVFGSKVLKKLRRLNWDDLEFEPGISIIRKKHPGGFLNEKKALFEVSLPLFNSKMDTAVIFINHTSMDPVFGFYHLLSKTNKGWTLISRIPADLNFKSGK